MHPVNLAARINDRISGPRSTGQRPIIWSGFEQEDRLFAPLGERRHRRATGCTRANNDRVVMSRHQAPVAVSRRNTVCRMPPFR